MSAKLKLEDLKYRFIQLNKNLQSLKQCLILAISYKKVARYEKDSTS